MEESAIAQLILVTCPKYVNLRDCKTSTISFSIARSFSTSTFCLRSLLVNQQIFLSTVISKTFSFLKFYSSLRVYVSELYKIIACTKIWYTNTFVARTLSVSQNAGCRLRVEIENEFRITVCFAAIRCFLQFQMWLLRWIGFYQSACCKLSTYLKH